MRIAAEIVIAFLDFAFDEMGFDFLPVLIKMVFFGGHIAVFVIIDINKLRSVMHHRNGIARQIIRAIPHTDEDRGGALHEIKLIMVFDQNRAGKGAFQRGDCLANRDQRIVGRKIIVLQ